MHLVQRQGQFGIIGNAAVGEADFGLIYLFEDVAQIEVVALRRQAAVDRAGTDGHQDLAVLAELAQHMHVLGIAQPTFDQAKIARSAVLDIGQRRAVEFDQVEQLEDPFVDVEDGHVAAEAAGQAGRGHAQFLHRGLWCVHGVCSAGCSLIGARS